MDKFCFVQDSKNLLILDEMKVLGESKTTCKIKGPGRLQTINEINGNRRRYSMAICEHFVNTANNKIKSKGLFGEMDHPLVSDLSDPVQLKRQSTVQFKDASHMFNEVKIDGNSIVGIVETLSNTNGVNMAKMALYDGINVGFSGRAMGKVQEISENGQMIYEVRMPAYFITWDAVTNPSHDRCNILDITEAVLDSNVNQKFKTALSENGSLNEDAYEILNTFNEFRETCTFEKTKNKIEFLIESILLGNNKDEVSSKKDIYSLMKIYLDSSDKKTGISKHKTLNESAIHNSLNEFLSDKKSFSNNKRIAKLFKKYIG